MWYIQYEYVDKCGGGVFKVGIYRTDLVIVQNALVRTRIVRAKSYNTAGIIILLFINIKHNNIRLDTIVRVLAHAYLYAPGNYLFISHTSRALRDDFWSVYI